MSRLYLSLVHHPVRARAGETVTTAVTNLDVHDLARSARSFGLGGYFIVTPISAQQALVQRILEHWSDTGSGVKRMPERAKALALARVSESVEAVCELLEERHGQPAKLVVTAARLPNDRPATPPAELRAEMEASEAPWLLICGTGHGLAEGLMRRADRALPPIRPGVYNHLSVRAAAAILLDRLLGDSGAESIA